MNLTNLLDYSNSIYGLGEKINRIERDNVKCDTKAPTVLKMLICGIFTGADSLNIMQHMYADKEKLRKSLFEKKEFIPKMTATRDCINDVDVNKITNIHYSMLNDMKANKVFENHKYRNTRVAIVDGVESFETHKTIEGLHKREHTDGSVGYYYKSLGISYLTDDFSIMLDLVPFRKNEMKDLKGDNDKIKSEGEITVLKRSIPILTEYKIEMAVMDAMFLNAPCLNAIKKENIEAVIRLKDERRSIYKDAKGLFDTTEAIKEYEIIEVKERKIIKYSKDSKKRNTDETETYIYTRDVTSSTLNKPTVKSNKTVEHPKKTVTKKVTEKVIKRVEVWSDIFQLDGYNYNNGYVRVIKTRETVIESNHEKSKEMYLVTTKLEEDLEFIIDLMHKRWTIELNCFRTLKSRYNMDHLYVGTNRAIQIITYLIMIVFNLIELYFNVHTRKYKKKINFKYILQNFKEELLSSEEFYKLFIT